MSFINTNFLPKRRGFISGNLGIGTDSTSYNLEVVGDINFTGTLYQNGTEFVSGGGGVWSANEDNTIYYSSNDVGIGTTNPTQKLEVVGNIKSTNYISDIDYTNSNDILGDILGDVGINILNRNYTGDPTAQWGVSVDSGLADFGLSVAVDADGNVYLAGYYDGIGTIYNANNTDSGSSLRNPTNDGVFVVKYNSSGIAQWFVSVDSGGNDYGFGVAVDSDGNVYLSGRYGLSTGSTATIYNANNASSGLTLANLANFAAYAVKYNSSGIAQWAVSVNANGADFGYSVAVDADGNLYFAGTYDGTGTAVIYNATNVNSGSTLRATFADSPAAFVVKYNSSGLMQWFVSVNSGSGDDQGRDVAVDADGNVYLAGYYGPATAYIYNANNTDSGLKLIASSGAAVFAVKYNSSGIVQWAVSVDSSSSDYGLNVAVDADGNVYLGGYYGAGAAIYNANNQISNLTLRTPSGGFASFVVKYNSSGIAQWAVSVDGSLSEYGTSVAVDPSGNIYCASTYSWGGTATATIYNANNEQSDITLRTTSSNAGALVVKYNSSGQALWAVSVDGTSVDEPFDIDIDSDSNIYVVGKYGAGVATIYNANNTSSGLTLRATSGENAAFVVKYSQTDTRYKLLNYSSSENDGTIKRLVNTTAVTIPVGVYSSDGTTLQYIIQLPPNSARQYIWYNNAWTLMNY